METKKYNKQNKIQKRISKGIEGIRKEATTIKERFKPSPQTTARLNDKGVGVYVPKLNRVKVGLGLVAMVVLIITPFTNWLSYYVLKWVLK